MNRDNSISHLIVSGQVSNKSERSTKTGKKIVVLNLKSDQGYYIDCECWSAICDKILVGELVVVSGLLIQDSWGDGENRKYKFKVQVLSIKNYLEEDDGKPY